MRAAWCAASRMAASALLLLALLASPIAALAQPADPAQSSLAAAQPRVQLTLLPGYAAEGEVRFTYSGDTTVPGKVSVLDYRIGPEGESVNPPAEQGAARWVSILTPTTLELQPNSAVTVRYRIQVPPDTPAGDHSALILMETEQTDPGTPRAGARLTINVPGEVRRQAELLSFGAERKPLRLLWLDLPNNLPLFDGGPIQLRAQVRNAGNVQLNTGGVIQIVDLFGNTVASYDLPTETVYPGDTRTLAAQWTHVPLVGWFTARLILDAGGSPLVAEERLLILPWQALLGFLLIIVFLRLMLGRGFGLPQPARRAAPAVAAAETAGRPAPASSAVPAPAAAELHAEAADQKVTALAAAWVAKGTQDGAPLERPEEEEPEEPLELAEPATAEVEGGPVSLADADAPLAAARAANGVVDESNDVLELLRLGQEAARSGEREEAYRFFVRALKINPDNEEAWLWRAGTAEHPREAIRSLEQVLLINPDNVRARRGLEELQRRFAPSQG